jgi:hypothetical protein
MNKKVKRWKKKEYFACAMYGAFSKVSGGRYRDFYEWFYHMAMFYGEKIFFSIGEI